MLGFQGLQQLVHEALNLLADLLQHVRELAALNLRQADFLSVALPLEELNLSADLLDALDCLRGLVVLQVSNGGAHLLQEDADVLLLDVLQDGSELAQAGDLRLGEPAGFRLRSR